MRPAAHVGSANYDVDDVEHVRGYRHARIKRETPRGLAWVGLAIFLLSVVNIAVGELTVVTLSLHTLVAIVFWASAWAIAREEFPASGVGALVAFCALAITLEFQFEFWADPTALGFAYVVIIMLASPPLILSPLEALVEGTLALIGAFAVAASAPQALEPSRVTDWLLLAVTAQVVGFILLSLRLRGIDELGRATRMAEELAARDALTGQLNRHGMELAIARIVAEAHRADAMVSACFVDVDGLKAANDQHGHDFGDEVLRAVADAVRAVAPEECAVGRWGGDEFLAFGPGTVPEAAIIADAITARLLESGIDLTRWPGTVSVGVAVEHARDLDLDRLISRADFLMYERRRAQRGGA